MHSSEGDPNVPARDLPSGACTHWPRLVTRPRWLLPTARRLKGALLQGWASASSLLGWWHTTLAALAPGLAARLASLAPVRLTPLPPPGMLQDLAARELAAALQQGGIASQAGGWATALLLRL